MEKYSSNQLHISLPCNLQTRTNTVQLSHSHLKDSRESLFLGEKDIAFQFKSAQSCKVIKLIGNKQNNIEEIVAQMSCVCGSKKQIRSILSLLMGKIYCLRQQRNQLRNRLMDTQLELCKFKNKTNVGVNTEKAFPCLKQDQQPFILERYQGQNISAENSENKLQLTKLRQLFKTEERQSLVFQRESNLLEESSVEMKASVQQDSLFQLSESSSKGRKVLGESNSPENKLKNFSKFLKANKFDLTTLENYIQKLNCAKEISRYQLKRRNKDVF